MIKGTIKTKGQVTGTVNPKVKAKGVVSVGGVLVGAALEKRGLPGIKGDTGDQGEKGDPFTYDDFTPEQLAALKGDKGDTGATGQDGHSPVVTASKVDDTTTVYVDGSAIATIDDGIDGQDGTDGQDGHSPVVTASKVGKVTTVSVDGSAIATINDGNDGQTGSDGQDGADGFSPSASVSKSGSIATITITDKNGTTSASVSDGSGVPTGGTSGQVLTKHSATDYDVSWEDPSGGGASAFIAEYGVTSYADVKDAYDEDAIIICTVDDSGNTVICQLAYYDDENGIFYFAQPQGDGFYVPSIASDDTWDDGYFQFASTDTATQLRDGLMSALDWQKLDGIESGAEVNVQSDWNEADNTADDYIKNKPTIPTVNNATLTIQKNGTTVNTFTANASSNVTANITVPTDTDDLTNGAGYITSSALPTKVSDLTNDAGYITGYTETDPIFTASDAYGIDSTDITNWDNSYDGKVSLDTSAQSGTTDGDLYSAIVALGWASDVIE